MYVLLSETGDAIFNGFTPNIKPRWISLRELKGRTCIQMYLYTDPKTEIANLSKMGIDVEEMNVEDLHGLIQSYERVLP